jgi:hypothetical protein
MKPGDRVLAQEISNKLIAFDSGVCRLPGISNPQAHNCLVVQMVDSIRRVKYVEVIRDKSLSDIYTNPHDVYYDPIKAASWLRQQGNLNEAFWQVFLATHFGKNKKSGWTLAKEIYKGEGPNLLWTWNNVSSNFLNFRQWLVENQDRIKRLGSFGNHRKYQSLDAHSNTGTGMAIGSYVDWVGSDHDHDVLIQDGMMQVGDDPKVLFNFLYNSMNQVVSFGRTARFDYLTMIGKLRLTPIIPDSTYMQQATGPKKGARLLFGGSVSANIGEARLSELLEILDEQMELFFGMQILEDALCNWQKSPERYVYFGG